MSFFSSPCYSSTLLSIFLWSPPSKLLPWNPHLMAHLWGTQSEQLVLGDIEKEEGVFGHGDEEMIPSWVSNPWIGLPWWLSGKEFTFDAGDVGPIPGSRRSLVEGIGNPLHYSCLENLHGQRSLVGYSLWGHSAVGQDLWTEQPPVMNYLPIPITCSQLHILRVTKTDLLNCTAYPDPELQITNANRDKETRSFTYTNQPKYCNTMQYNI